MTDELLCNLGLVDRKRNTDRDQMILVSLQCHWELGTGQLGKFPTTFKLNLAVFTIDRRCYPSVNYSVIDSQRTKINQIYLASYMQIVTRSVSQNYARLLTAPDFG